MRMGGRDEEEDGPSSDVLVVVVLGRRGFWVRKTEPRAFWEVLERRSEREEKNCDGLVQFNSRQAILNRNVLPLRGRGVLPS